MSAQTLRPILLLLIALIYCCEATQSHCSVHSDCQSCVQDGTFLGPCRWCVHDNACHDAGAIITNPCKKVDNIVSLAAPNGCDCVKAYNDVMNRRDELVKRIQDIIADDRKLPVTGKFSVASHVDQLQQKQVNMRRLLTTFDNLQCKQDTENAESLAAAPVPSTAKTAQLNNVPESKLNALAEVLGLSAVALAIVFAAPALIEASALAAFCAAFLPATDASTSSEAGQPSADSPSSPSSAQLAGIVVGCVAAAAVVVGAGAVVFRRRKVRAEQERAEQMTVNPLDSHESEARYSAL